MALGLLGGLWLWGCLARLGLLIKLWQAQAPSSRKADFLGFYFGLAAPRAATRQLAAACRACASRAIAPAADQPAAARRPACVPASAPFASLFPVWRAPLASLRARTCSRNKPAAPHSPHSLPCSNWKYQQAAALHLAFHLSPVHFCPCACHNLIKRPLRYGSGVGLLRLWLWGCLLPLGPFN